MPNTKASPVYGVNENGEIVATNGSGSSTITNFLPASEIPVDVNGKLAIVGIGGGASTGYFAHYHAPSQGATDAKLYDLLGSADGTFGANLTVAQAWANAGYVSTLDPAVGAVDSSIQLPALGWDWQGGESLLVFWRGKATPEGATTGVFGQTSSNALKGAEFRMITGTGQCQMVGYGPGSDTNPKFGPSTPNSAGLKPFVSGEEHSFAFAFDPVARNCQVFVDGEYTQTLNFPSQDTYNTTNPFKIGTSSAVAVSTVGAAIQTRAFAILKGRKNVPLPTSLKAAMRRLHRFPDRLLTTEAW